MGKAATGTLPLPQNRKEFGLRDGSVLNKEKGERGRGKSLVHKIVRRKTCIENAKTRVIRPAFSSIASFFPDSVLPNIEGKSIYTRNGRRMNGFPVFVRLRSQIQRRGGRRRDLQPNLIVSPVSTGEKKKKRGGEEEALNLSPAKAVLPSSSSFPCTVQPTTAPA